MTGMNKERRDFEAAAARVHYRNFSRYNEGLSEGDGYCVVSLQSLWNGWQLRAAFAAVQTEPTQAQPVIAVGQVFSNGADTVVVAQNAGIRCDLRLDPYPPTGLVYAGWFRSQSALAAFLSIGGHVSGQPFELVTPQPQPALAAVQLHHIPDAGNMVQLATPDTTAGEPVAWQTLARECLSSMEGVLDFRKTGLGRPPEQTCMLAIDGLKAMLAAPQPAKATGTEREIAVVTDNYNKDFSEICRTSKAPIPLGTKLYTTPQPARMLTDEEVHAAWDAPEPTNAILRKFCEVNGITLKEAP